jgi:hypothetical protein
MFSIVIWIKPELFKASKSSTLVSIMAALDKLLVNLKSEPSMVSSIKVVKISWYTSVSRVLTVVSRTGF